MSNTPDYADEFRLWLEKPLGKQLINLENGRIQSMIATLFGYDAVVVGEPKFIQCLAQSTIKHKNVLNPSNLTLISAGSGICTRLDKLAIASESIDLVYLAHCLELANNPHEVLREAYRILRPDGHLVISMFNPISLWGIWRILAKFGQHFPARANFMSVVKLKDWLALLGFDIMQVKNFGFFLPFNCCKTSGDLGFFEARAQRFEIPFGAAYLLEASKRVMPLTPIRPMWQTEPEIVTNDITEPSA